MDIELSNGLVIKIRFFQDGLFHINAQHLGKCMTHQLTVVAQYQKFMFLGTARKVSPVHVYGNTDIPNQMSFIFVYHMWSSVAKQGVFSEMFYSRFHDLF